MSGVCQLYFLKNHFPWNLKCLWSDSTVCLAKVLDSLFFLLAWFFSVLMLVCVFRRRYFSLKKCISQHDLA